MALAALFGCDLAWSTSIRQNRSNPIQILTKWRSRRFKRGRSLFSDDRRPARRVRRDGPDRGHPRRPRCRPRWERAPQQFAQILPPLRAQASALFQGQGGGHRGRGVTDLALERARLALDVPAAFEALRPPAPKRKPRPPRLPRSSPAPAITAATANSPSCRPASQNHRRPGQAKREPGS
jgi:hypothetical protein